MNAFRCLLAAAAAFATLASAAHAQTAQVDKLGAAAASVGVKRCLPAITRLSSLNLQGSRSHELLLDWDRKRPDDGALFAFLGIEYPNAGVATSITALPAPGEGCTVAAERISVAPFTCASVAQQELPGYQVNRLLPIYTVYVDPKDPASSVSLIDSPPGCLVIRRYVQYGWVEPGAAPAARGAGSGRGR